MNNSIFKSKYIKYKVRYLELKDMLGGVAAHSFKVTIIKGLKGQDVAHQFKGSGKKIGLLIAGNAGRPGGGLGKVDGTGLDSDFTKRFSTQEEDVVSHWLLAEQYYHEIKHGPGTFDADTVFRQNLGDMAPGGRPWGMKYPSTRVGAPGSTHTLQGRDFTHPFYDSKRGLRMDQRDNYNFAYSLTNKPISNSKKNATKMVDLVFVYGPNVAYRGKSPNSTGTRTLVHNYRDVNYPVFRESVKMALRAGLIEMARNGNQIAILAPISGGIYSGKGTATNVRINSEYEQIINELLNEDYTPGVKLGSKFEDVIFPIYP
jgi:hypothetical protein